MAIITLVTSISFGTEGNSISSPVGDHSAVLMNTDKCKRQRQGVSVGMEEKGAGWGEGMIFKEIRTRRHTPSTEVFNVMRTFS